MDAQRFRFPATLQDAQRFVQRCRQAEHQSGDVDKVYSRTLRKNNFLRRLFRRQRVDPGHAHTLLDSDRIMGAKSANRRAKKPGTLILVRNGQFNETNEFTGWLDPDISELGIRESENAARLIRESGYNIDVVYCSRLKRAIHSTWAILRELDQVYLPVFKSWRLNGRFYGALTGLSKAQVAELMGPERVQEWRTDPTAIPPKLPVSSRRWPGRDRRYSDISPERLPCTESLSECIERVGPLWEKRIKPELSVGHDVLVIGRGASLRGLVKHIQGLDDDKIISRLNIPPGIPSVYEFNRDLKPLHKNDDDSSSLLGTFLEKPGRLQEALRREAEWKLKVPGYNATMSQISIDRAMSSLEMSLTKLQAERELEEWTSGPEVAETTRQYKGVATRINGGTGYFIDEDEAKSIISTHPCLATLPEGVELPANLKLPPRRGATVVMIRHGKTSHNQLGLFTGWEDAPLAPEGVAEAKEAGKLLRQYGFEFDVVYSSWLSRAIETAWHIMDELDCTWLPMVKSWRLNERMYGSLTGKSKKMISRQYGEEQFYQWRRGYTVRPPPVDSFSPDFPGNDPRNIKFMTDIRYSISESIIRSIERKRLTLYRSFPKTESLRDCIQRTIPFFVRNIMPEAVENSKRILIASSENAIRGLLMHLWGIPEIQIANLNIPNDVPIIYDINTRSVKLLGGGSIEAHKESFGSAAEYLFRVNDVDDEECDVDELSDEVLEILNAAHSATSGDSVLSESSA